MHARIDNNMINRYLLAMIYAMLIVSCGAKPVPVSSGSSIGPGGLQDIERHFTQQLISELDARGIDPLKAVNLPPSGYRNKLMAVQAIPDGTGGWMLRWRYVNAGDYNRDGIVNVADITPIAAHFGNPNSLIGEDGSALVGVSDITPIAQHFASEVAGFIVEVSPTVEGPFEELGRIAFNQLVEIGGWIYAQIPLGMIDNRYYRIKPVDSAGNWDVVSEPYNSGLSAPVINTVRPLTACKGIASAFQADVTGEGLVNYEWTFGASASPNSSTDENPSVIFLSVGDFMCSLTVTTVFGLDTKEFTVKVVEYGDAPFISNILPTSALLGVQVKFGAIVGGQEPLAYSWSFSGGSPAVSVERNPEIVFSSPGLHEVSLTVANAIDSDVYSFYLDVIEGLDMELIAIRVEIEGTRNTLPGSIYEGTGLFAMPLSGNAQGEGDIGSVIHGRLDSYSYIYEGVAVYGFDDPPPPGKLGAYNATLQYLRSAMDWTIEYGSYPESELITLDPAGLPGELLGEISMIAGSYAIIAEVPAGVLGLAMPEQVVIDMNFVESSG